MQNEKEKKEEKEEKIEGEKDYNDPATYNSFFLNKNLDKKPKLYGESKKFKLSEGLESLDEAATNLFFNDEKSEDK